ncbi:hypothetical protein GX411_02950 [Candidatus Fermentibacteria bacterium]|nr:hypothetical protein [Candidatus Fermentibacteria bacterium]
MGLLMSAGYDSRLLLAALLEQGLRPVLFTWTIPNPTREEQLVAAMARHFGLRHRIIDPASLTSVEILQTMREMLASGDRIPRLEKSHIVASLARTAEEADILFWGEGEIIRPPSLPSEAMPQYVAGVLGLRPRVPIEVPCLFDPAVFDDGYLASLETALSGLPGTSGEQKGVSWLALFAYPGLFCNLASSICRPGFVKLPFLAGDFVEACLCSRFRLSDRRGLKNNLQNTMLSRRLYRNILSRLCPDLLDFATDRGYSPRLDPGPAAWMFTAARGMRRKYLGRSDGPAVNRIGEALLSLLREHEVIEYSERRSVEALLGGRIPIDSAIETSLSRLIAMQNRVL